MSFNSPQKVDGLQRRPTSLRAFKVERPQKHRQKAAYERVAIQELLSIVVIRGTRQFSNRRHGGFQLRLENALEARERTASSPHSLSRRTKHASRSCKAAASRSRMVRSRSRWPTRSAREKVVRMSRSNTSRASSWAVASNAEAKASRVAIRRDSGIRLMVWTRAEST